MPGRKTKMVLPSAERKTRHVFLGIIPQSWGRSEGNLPKKKVESSNKDREFTEKGA